MLAQSERQLIERPYNYGIVLLIRGGDVRAYQNCYPKMKANWQKLAFAMKYDNGEVDAFDKEGRDFEERCYKMFNNWLTTGHGPTPKTYETLLKYIKKVDDLTAACEEIEKELIKGNDKGLALNNNYFTLPLFLLQLYQINKWD